MRMHSLVLVISAMLVAAAPPSVETTRASADALDQLHAYLRSPAVTGRDLSDGDALTELAKQPFSKVALTKKDATQAAQAMWKAYVTSSHEARAKEIDSGAITVGGIRMPIACTEYEAKSQDPKVATEKGKSLWISLHGGGGAPAKVNDQQWENQKRLYTLSEGIYVAPRAPTNEWNLWHLDHIDALFARLIQDMVIAKGVDPDRVYIMGYSAGGDGVYQLAPRMADRWAAAGMMAGHPNDAKPDGLRNIGFTLHVGEKDAAFDRNKVGAQWKDQLDALQRKDPKGYAHWVEICAGKGHWMDRQDAAAIPWMSKFTRNLRPERVVWLQDDVVHPRFYWLAVDSPKAGARVVAERRGQTIQLAECPKDASLRIRLDDAMMDLDKPVTVTRDGARAFSAVPQRTIATLATTLAERGDPKGMFSAEITLGESK